MSKLSTKPHERLLRESFAQRLTRLCNALSIGHFLCVPFIYFLEQRSIPGTTSFSISTTILLSGLVLLLIAQLTKYNKYHQGLMYLCLALLLGQISYYIAQTKDLFHPLTMVFPLVTSLATPTLGKNKSYYTAATCGLILLCFYLSFLTRDQSSQLGQLLPFLLLQGLILFAAYLSETLWAEILNRGAELERAAAQIEARNLEMQTWVESLTEAQSQIIAGNLNTHIPIPPPDKTLKDLSQNVVQIQMRLNQYFSNLMLKDRLSSIGILASGVAHELNTPLTTLQFMLHSDTQLPPDIRNTMLGEIERMSKITHDLLDFARPHSEELFDLNEIVERTKPLLKQKPRELIITYDLSTLKTPLTGVAHQIQQILINLIHNSIDASEKVALPKIEVKTERRDDGVLILSVQDNGSGMDKDTLAKVLDPFFSTKNPGRGTGLGLFIVNEIVHRHDSIMTIDSTPGVGTTIRILFLQNGKTRKEAA